MVPCSSVLHGSRRDPTSPTSCERPHNPKVGGSNPPPATIADAGQGRCRRTGLLHRGPEFRPFFRRNGAVFVVRVPPDNPTILEATTQRDTVVRACAGCSRRVSLCPRAEVRTCCLRFCGPG